MTPGSYGVGRLVASVVMLGLLAAGCHTAADREGPTAEVEGPAADRGAPTAEVEGPAADRGAPTAEVEGPAADRGAPTAEVEGPAADRGAPTAEVEDSVDEAVGSGDEAGASTAAEPAGPNGGLARLVEQMPAPGSGLFVSGENFHRAFDAYGLSIPPDCTDERGDDFIADLVGISTRSGAMRLPLLAELAVDVESLDHTFGFSLCEVAATLEAGVEQPIMFDVTSTERIEEVIRSDDEWNDRLEVTAMNSATVYDWGDDIDFERISPVRRLGRGGQLLVDGQTVARTVMRDSMDRLIDPSTERLADVPFVRETVAYFDATGVFSFVLSESFVTDQPAGELDPTQLLVPWRLLGVGIAVGSDDVPEMRVVIQHDSAADAEVNAVRLEQMLSSGSSTVADLRWSDVFELVKIDSRDGAVFAIVRSVAEIEPPGRRGITSVVVRDTLFGHG